MGHRLDEQTVDVPATDYDITLTVRGRERRLRANQFHSLDATVVDGDTTFEYHDNGSYSRYTDVSISEEDDPVFGDQEEYDHPLLESIQEATSDHPYELDTRIAATSPHPYKTTLVSPPDITSEGDGRTVSYRFRYEISADPVRYRHSIDPDDNQIDEFLDIIASETDVDRDDLETGLERGLKEMDIPDPRTADDGLF